MIHEGLMEHGSLMAPAATEELSDLRAGTPVAQYITFGVMPDLVVPTQRALTELARVEVERGDRVITIAVAFQQVVATLNAASVRKRAARNIHLLGLAYHYGVRFASMEDVPPIFAAIQNLMGPALKGLDKVPQRTQYWERCGEMFAYVGKHMQCEPVPEVLPSGLTFKAFTQTLELMVRLRCVMPMCKLLTLGALIADGKIDIATLCGLVTAAPERVDDMIALLMDETLGTDGAKALLEDPRILSVLGLPALVDFLAVLSERTDGQTVIGFARFLGDALQASNQEHQLTRAVLDLDREELDAEASAEEEVTEEDPVELEEEPPPEPEPVSAPIKVVLPPFDHSRLDIATYVTGKVSLRAVQVWLVFGVLQPDQRVSTMLTGSQVSQSEMEERCRVQFDRLRIPPKDRERAWSFLTMGQVLQRVKRGGRVRFNRELKGNERMVPIVAAVLDLNTQIDRP
ncbi:MAG: hypothetical protein HQ488_01565 [Parcubacteria group bacterium]|nr:hypothetical protein [Parcubacteria group bacterium]